MATSVTVDIQGAMTKLETAQTGIDLPVILGAIGQRLLKWVDDTFKAEGPLDGDAWAPLKPQTIKRRRAGSSAILQNTGRLKQSYVMNVGNESVTVGTSVNYAQYHEFGTKFLPIRRMLPLEATAEELAHGVVQAIVDKATGNGAG